MKIAIIDAGLGGLSVQAMLDKALRVNKDHSECELLFFNVMPASGKLYLHMEEEERRSVFEKMLFRVLGFEPSVIMIACNSLSVLYPHISKRPLIKTNVIGIVDFGVNLISDYAKEYRLDNLVVLGTPMTINSNTHEKKLIEQGINENRIISQPCKELQYYIQLGQYDLVGKMLETFLRKAKDKIKMPSKTIALALCCTHYYFAESMFKTIAQKVFDAKVTILNPNEVMTTAITTKGTSINEGSIQITNRVYSFMEVNANEISSLGALIKKESPDVFQALKHYTRLSETYTALG